MVIWLAENEEAIFAAYMHRMTIITWKHCRLQD